MPGLESLYIRLQPLINVGRAQIDKLGQILGKIGSPFRVVDLLPGIVPLPGLTESLEMVFTVYHRSIRSR